MSGTTGAGTPTADTGGAATPAMVWEAVDLASLERRGFVEIGFRDPAPLDDLRRTVEVFFPCPPEDWHTRPGSQDEHVELVQRIGRRIAERDLVTSLVERNLRLFVEIFGPDIDIQAFPLLRISRPRSESDTIDWHRDTFYGNTPWELNLWFPLFPLRPGAGLWVRPGSHVLPSVNVRPVAERDPFRATVTKGSPANEIGYTYAPKTDDSIEALHPSETVLLAPEVGRAILFFGRSIHRAQNTSTHTRVTIDLRMRNAHTPTQAKPGYYRALCRGVVARCVERLP